MEDDMEWEEYMGKDVMIKRVCPGSGIIAEMKYIVKANVIMYRVVHEPDDLELIETIKEASFQIGEGDAVPGLELALRHSSVGEKLRVRCTEKFGFGSTTLVTPPLPAHSDLEFDVEILEHINLDNPGGDEMIPVDIASRKEAGNRWYSCGDFMRAGRCFTKGAQTAEKNLASLTTSKPGKTQSTLYLTVAQLYLDCLNNLAACHLSLKDHFKAREACIKVLEADSKNTRGLLRAGKASLGLHEYDESRICFKSLLELQKSVLDKLSSDESGIESDISKATEDIKITESWLKKVRKAEVEYRKRDRNIGKRISKGLFEGKEPISVIDGSNNNEKANFDSSVFEGATNNCQDEKTAAETSTPDMSHCYQGKESVDENVEKATLEDKPRVIDKDLNSSTSVHPIIEHLYNYELYYYSAVFVASVAIGIRMF